MTNEQQAPEKMPLYNNADFTCGHCESVWKADFTDIAKLRNKMPIACKTCHCELVMTYDDLLLLEHRFEESEKLSKRAIWFAIPYFIVCAAIGFLYSGIITIIMIIAGFMILMTMRSSLTKNGIDHFQLEPIIKKPLNSNPHKQHKRKRKKKANH